MRPLHALRLLALLAFVPIALAQPAQPVDQFTGDVVTADGKPAAGATVALQGDTNGDYNSPFTQIATADADGKFAISPRPGVRDAFAVIPAVGTSTPVRPLKSPAHFKLLPAVDVELTFLTPDGKPAAALNISPKNILFRSDGETFPLFLGITRDVAAQFSAKTDAAGKCTLHGLPRQSQVFFVFDDPRFAHLDMTNRVSLEGDGPVIQARPITLTAAATISGTLLNPETHAPMPGLRVSAQSHDSARQGWGTATTDAQGNFTIGQLPPSFYALTLGNPDDNSSPFVAAAVDVKLAEGEHAHANLTLERGGTLQGIVRDATTGKGLPNMNVGLYGAARPRHAGGIESRNTDANGRFSFHVPAGEQYPYLAMETPDGYLTPSGDGMQTVTVAAGQTVEVAIDLKPDPNPLIEGRVVDPDGKPAPHASIQIQNGRPFGRSIPTDDNGHFRFHAKPGTKLTARLGDLATAIPEVASADAPMEIQLEKQARFTLIVKITDDAHNPVPGATAELFTNNGQFGTGGPKRPADAAGIVRFESVATDGKYDVWAQADGYGVTQAKVGFPPLDDPRELELPITIHKATEEISGRVLDKDNKPVPHIAVELNGAKTGVLRTTTDADGHFLFHVVKRANAAIYVVPDDGAVLTPSTARAGDKDLELHNYKDAKPPTRDPLP